MMEMQASISGVKQLGSNVWETSLSPSEVRRLCDCTNSIGAVSVVILSDAPTHVGADKMTFDIAGAAVTNVGSTARTLIINGKAPPTIHDRLARQRELKAEYSEGDKIFLNCLKILPPEVRTAGEKLLAEIRNHFPGSLRRVSETRFQETPDNFWFVTVQPRAKSILITVRGLPDIFQPSTLNILEDRRPYSRFKVNSVADVSEAVRILRTAVKRVR